MVSPLQAAFSDDPYRVLVTSMLLIRTQANQVTSVFSGLF
jgi:adenine-specific DNA glycosylase